MPAPDERASTQRPFLLLVVLVLAIGPPLLYITGYCWLSRRADVYTFIDENGERIGAFSPQPGRQHSHILRDYQRGWCTTAFYPLAQVEGALTGTEVQLSHNKMRPPDPEEELLSR